MTNTDTSPAPTSTLTYSQWSVDANTLPAKAVHYLLSNGFTQSMTDAAAFTKEQKAKFVEEGAKEGHDAETSVANAAKAARDKRFAAILAGEVGVRAVGPRLPQIDRVMRDIAEEMLRAIAAERQVAMPKGDVLKAALDKILAKHADVIRTKAQARMDESKAMADDLGDILG